MSYGLPVKEESEANVLFIAGYVTPTGGAGASSTSVPAAAKATTTSKSAASTNGATAGLSILVGLLLFGVTLL